MPTDGAKTMAEMVHKVRTEKADIYLYIVKDEAEKIQEP